MRFGETFHAMGGKLIKTPNIDRLASEGIRFTDGYVSAPVSGASRVGLLTGFISKDMVVESRPMDKG